jgi:hypothetical protein
LKKEGATMSATRYESTSVRIFEKDGQYSFGVYTTIMEIDGSRRNEKNSKKFDRRNFDTYEALSEAIKEATGYTIPTFDKVKKFIERDKQIHIEVGNTTKEMHYVRYVKLATLNTIVKQNGYSSILKDVKTSIEKENQDQFAIPDEIRRNEGLLVLWAIMVLNFGGYAEDPDGYLKMSYKDEIIEFIDQLIRD